MFPQSEMGISNGSPSDSQHCQPLSPCSPHLQPDFPGRDRLGDTSTALEAPQTWKFYHPKHLFTFHITGRCPRNLPFKGTLGVCTGGRVEGLADVISTKKQLCHKPHCCVIHRTMGSERKGKPPLVQQETPEGRKDHGVPGRVG